MPLPHPDPAKRVDLALRVYRARLARAEALDERLHRLAGDQDGREPPAECEEAQALTEAIRRLRMARNRVKRFQRGTNVART